MGKYISLGEYNKLYKHLWIYLIIEFITLFIFDYGLIFEKFKTEILEIPESPFISIQFEYIFFIIISILILIIKKCRKESKINIVANKQELIYHKPNIGLKLRDYFLLINLFFVLILDLLQELIYKLRLSMFSFWMFEMLFFELFNSRLLKTKIYKHHIYSFIFILSTGSIIKIIIIIINFTNDTNDVRIFDHEKWLIPTAIIFYFLYHIFSAYTYSIEKYYLQKRVISISSYLLIYGIFGLILSSICGIISSSIPCGDDTISELAKIICTYKDDNGTYYFSSYNLYFKELTSKYLAPRIILIIIHSLLYYVSNYYVYVIYKKLSPIYHICIFRFDNLILNILNFINRLINDDIQSIKISISILNILLLSFYLIGSIVYLEFIELNFCDLNFYTKRQIKERAKMDINISLNDIMNINSDEDSNMADE